MTMTAMILSAAPAVSVYAEGTDDSDMTENTQEVERREIRNNRGQRPGRTPDKNGEFPPELPEGEMPEMNGERPELPNGEMPEMNGERPELPEGEMPGMNGERPELPEGEMPEMNGERPELPEGEAPAMKEETKSIMDQIMSLFERLRNLFRPAEKKAEPTTDTTETAEITQA